jgi:small subunit ribosomal protein S14
MAKIGVINKMNKVRDMVAKQAAKRTALRDQRSQARSGALSFEDVMAVQEAMNKLSRNGCKTRFHNRCLYDGRPRGFMRKFGMNRVLFRKLANEGKIAGVTKASW